MPLKLSESLKATVGLDVCRDDLRGAVESNSVSSISLPHAIVSRPCSSILLCFHLPCRCYLILTLSTEPPKETTLVSHRMGLVGNNMNHMQSTNIQADQCMLLRIHFYMSFHIFKVVRSRKLDLRQK